MSFRFQPEAVKEIGVSPCTLTDNGYGAQSFYPTSTMLSTYYACTACGQRFNFKCLSADYYLGELPLGAQVNQEELFPVPVRPAWCKTCDALTLVEDIASVRDFENAYGAVRKGRHIEYPINSDCMEPAAAEKCVATYLRWRMHRRHAARALCCGRSNYQFMDVELPLFKHAGCDFGFIEPGHFSIGSYCGPGPGVYAPANTPVYSAEGELIGKLTWRQRGEWVWDVEPLDYPPHEDD